MNSMEEQWSTEQRQIIEVRRWFTSEENWTPEDNAQQGHRRTPEEERYIQKRADEFMQSLCTPRPKQVGEIHPNICPYPLFPAWCAEPHNPTEE